MDKLKAAIIATLLLFLLFGLPSFSRGRLILHVKNRDDQEIYVIDYRGPETHKYIPPPTWAPKIHHHTHHKSKVFKGKRNGKKIPG